MTPIIAVFMSMISLLALVADRANLQEQTLSVHGASIPLPNVDDGVARNFLDVAKRTLPFKMTPARAITLRRVPRAAGSASVYKLRSGPAPSTGLGPAAPGGRDLDLGDVDAETILFQSLLLSALSERFARGRQPAAVGTAATTRAAAAKAAPSAPEAPGRRDQPETTPQPDDDSLGELKEDIMVHGRDRDQLRRRWKIENSGNRVASAHRRPRPSPGEPGAGAVLRTRALPVKRRP